MTPSQVIIGTAEARTTIIDAEGRKLALRRLTALDKLRLFKAAGPILAQNQPWLGMALLACSVAAIDDVPVPPPVNEQQIETMVSRLGDAGIAAIADAFGDEDDRDPAELSASAGN
jgi:hypothetical protein